MDRLAEHRTEGFGDTSARRRLHPHVEHEIRQAARRGISREAVPSAVAKGNAHFDWQAFRQTKTYDFLMGLPLIYWFGYVEGVRLRPFLETDARAMWLAPSSLLLDLRFFSLFASVAFNLLTVYLIVVRTSPVRRSRGWLPRAFGFAGTFFGISIQYLRPASLSLNGQILASSLILLGCAGSIVVLSRLGRSFSIMPEARKFVADGPYALARHPLYAFEFISVVGSTLMFQQPWAGILAAGVMALLVARSHFEEQVLIEAYPEYTGYRARVKRFGFV